MQHSNQVSTGSPTPNNGRDRYAADLTGAAKKDACVIMYGTNDLGWTPETNFSLSKFTTDYQAVITGLLTAGYAANRIVLCAPPYISTYNYSGTFTGANSSIHQTYIDAVKNLASTNGLYYADTFNIIKYNGATALLSDGLHPNDAGHVYLKTAILNASFV